MAGRVWALHGGAWPGQAGAVRHGQARRGPARPGTAGAARFRAAGPCMAPQGSARRGLAGPRQAWRGWARRDKVRHVAARQAGHGGAWSARQGPAWRGQARQARQGMVWRGALSRGAARLGPTGLAWRGVSGHGLARHGRHGSARPGRAWPGQAGRGWAGSAGPGRALLGAVLLGTAGRQGVMWLGPGGRPGWARQARPGVHGGSDPRARPPRGCSVTPRLERRNYGRGHGYKIDGHKVPGVTTALKVIAKPALIDWAARTTAEAADRPMGRARRRSPQPPDCKELNEPAGKPTRKPSSVATKSTPSAKHSPSAHPIDVPPQHVGPVQAYARFLDKWEIDFIGTEAPCANPDIGYAGTLDGVAATPRLNDGKPIVLDIKTGNGVFAETALQARRLRTLHPVAAPRPRLRRADAGHRRAVRRARPARRRTAAARPRRHRPALPPVPVRAGPARWDESTKEDTPIGAAL